MLFKVTYIRTDGGMSSQTVSGCSSREEAIEKVRRNASNFSSLFSVTEV